MLIHTLYNKVIVLMHVFVCVTTEILMIPDLNLIVMIRDWNLINKLKFNCNDTRLEFKYPKPDKAKKKRKKSEQLFSFILQIWKIKESFFLSFIWSKRKNWMDHSTSCDIHGLSITFRSLQASPPSFWFINALSFLRICQLIMDLIHQTMPN